MLKVKKTKSKEQKEGIPLDVDGTAHTTMTDEEQKPSSEAKDPEVTKPRHAEVPETDDCKPINNDSERPTKRMNTETTTPKSAETLVADIIKQSQDMFATEDQEQSSKQTSQDENNEAVVWGFGDSDEHSKQSADKTSVMDKTAADGDSSNIVDEVIRNITSSVTPSAEGVLEATVKYTAKKASDELTGHNSTKKSSMQNSAMEQETVLKEHETFVSDQLDTDELSPNQNSIEESSKEQHCSSSEKSMAQRENLLTTDFERKAFAKQKYGADVSGMRLARMGF